MICNRSIIISLQLLLLIVTILAATTTTTDEATSSSRRTISEDGGHDNEQASTMTILEDSNNKKFNNNIHDNIRQHQNDKNNNAIRSSNGDDNNNDKVLLVDQKTRNRKKRRRLKEEKKQKTYTKEQLSEKHNSYNATSLLKLFEYSKEYNVIGPSSFPKPTRIISSNKKAKPYIKPYYGTHRSNKDAIFILSSEYELINYLCFIETLKENAGPEFNGDVVLAITKLDLTKNEIKQYLTADRNYHGNINLVVYVIDINCFNFEGNILQDSKGGSRVCHINNLYGIPDKETDTSETEGTSEGTTERSGNTENLKPIKDPRSPRTPQIYRYELYWLWSQQYNKHTWIMLVDARDSYFQSNPFANVPRRSNSNKNNNDGDNDNGGLLYFFGENVNATRIGKSPKNKKWILNSYGNIVLKALQDKPTICSGSTMGEQIAIDEYLKAMVYEADETGVVLVGADQGFHNYLYYSNKLSNVNKIKNIIVYGQGLGIINNLGALRIEPLYYWGDGNILNTYDETKSYSDRIKTNGIHVYVYNWNTLNTLKTNNNTKTNTSTQNNNEEDEERLLLLSPVVHQFDRHPIISKYVYKYKGKLYRDKWNKYLQEQKEIK